MTDALIPAGSTVETRVCGVIAEAMLFLRRAGAVLGYNRGEVHDASLAFHHAFGIHGVLTEPDA